MLALKGDERGGEQIGARRHGDGHRHLPAVPRARPAHRVLRFPQHFQRALGVWLERLARRGKRHPAPLPLEQRRAQFRFKRLQPLGYGGLPEPGFGGGAAERTMANDDEEEAELISVHIFWSAKSAKGTEKRFRDYNPIHVSDITSQYPNPLPLTTTASGGGLLHETRCRAYHA